MIGKYSAKDPQAVLALIENLPEKDRLITLSHLAAKANLSNSSLGLSVVNSLPPAEQARYAQDYFRAWARENPAAASATVASYSLPDGGNGLIAVVAEQLTDADGGAQKALDWADNLATEGQRAEAVDSIYAAWGASAPSKP